MRTRGCTVLYVEKFCRIKRRVTRGIFCQALTKSEVPSPSHQNHPPYPVSCNNPTPIFIFKAVAAF